MLCILNKNYSILHFDIFALRILFPVNKHILLPETDNCFLKSAGGREWLEMISWSIYKKKNITGPSRDQTCDLPLRPACSSSLQLGVPQESCALWLYHSWVSLLIFFTFHVNPLLLGKFTWNVRAYFLKNQTEKMLQNFICYKFAWHLNYHSLGKFSRRQIDILLVFPRK